MRQYITLGSAPLEEECVQVSNEDYIIPMRDECKRFKQLLEQKFSDRPEGCYFTIKTFHHDFGNYFEVVIHFDDEVEEQVDYAYSVEGSLPERWEGENL